jgi:hypothetical protein
MTGRLTADFADRGLLIRPGSQPLRRFQVMGERSSGTNLVKRLLGRNTALRPSDCLGWKHGFPQMIAIPDDLLVVCCLRDARDWALSMHAKPWHTPPAMQRLDFSAFLRAPWESVADHPRYFPQVAAEGGAGTPLQQDRHPLTGAVFANLFALRRAKLQALLSYLERGCAVVLCRMEGAQQDPEGFTAAIRAGLALPEPAQGFRPVQRRLGSKFRPAIAERPATPARLGAEDLALLRASLDLPLEARLGYRYD